MPKTDGILPFYGKNLEEVRVMVIEPLLTCRLSVFALGFDELAVQAGDVAQRDAFGAFSRASAGVGTVTETKLVHFLHHGTGSARAFHLTLGKKSELAHLC